MASWLPAIPYPPAGDGYWSPVTATLDWCEENYYATTYSAEIVNTLTNLLFQFLALKGVANTIKHGHDAVFVVVFLGCFCVASGSFVFHATLKYPWQLVDELSMIYTTCLMCHATFTFHRSLAFSIGFGVFLTALALFITLYYHYLQDPIFHQNAYAVLTAVVLLRSIYIMEMYLRPSFKRKREAAAQNGQVAKVQAAERQRQDDRDAKILSAMWVMVAYGLSVFLGGFLIWNLDNWYCGTLRRWRHEIGLPWGLLLEGHGWWHVMTGIGAYFYVVWGIWLRHCVNGKQDEYEIVWPRLVTSLPVIVRKQKTGMNGKKNL